MSFHIKPKGLLPRSEWLGCLFALILLHIASPNQSLKLESGSTQLLLFGSSITFTGSCPCLVPNPLLLHNLKALSRLFLFLSIQTFKFRVLRAIAAKFQS